MPEQFSREQIFHQLRRAADGELKKKTASRKVPESGPWHFNQHVQNGICASTSPVENVHTVTIESQEKSEKMQTGGSICEKPVCKGAIHENFQVD